MSDTLRELLRGQYTDSSNIRLRQAFHERFRRRETTREEWVLEQLQLPADGRVLDVGCGEGTIWYDGADRLPPGLSVTLYDLSPGILSDTRGRFESCAIDPHCVAGDAQRLPFASGTFDAILAIQMLYHVPDRSRAYAEFDRVLGDDGCVYVTVPPQDNCQALWDLINEVTDSSTPSLPAGFPDGYAPETIQDELAAKFSEVERRVFTDELSVDDPDALVAWARSIVDLDGIELEPETVEELRALASERMHVSPVTAKSDYIFLSTKV